MKTGSIKYTIKNSVATLLMSIMLLLLSFGSVFAQVTENRISLSVTPPLFQLSVEPGGRWASSVKMVNGGAFDIEVYATPVNFKAQGESGSSKFIPIMDGLSEGLTAAEWIDISRGPYAIPAEGSIDIPFTVSVPEDATPGGHYAALLIGTEPVDGASEGSVVRVSSLVTSLLLMRVEGEIVESGHIREFRTDAGWYDRPEARFTVRFQNTGTVHLQPRGVIEVYNMWGTKRGTIPINTGGQFGNVLPDSSRSFSFRWEGDGGVFDAGRYTADVTLAYGTDGSRNVNESVTFWVLPLVPLLTVLGITLALVLIIAGSISLYIKRVLAYEKRRMNLDPGRPRRVVSASSLKAPIREGVINMKRDIAETSKRPAKEAFWEIVKRYRLTVFAVFATVFLILAFYLLFSSGIDPDRGFRIFEERTAGEAEVLP